MFPKNRMNLKPLVGKLFDFWDDYTAIPGAEHEPAVGDVQSGL